ncbi:hypothetical protein BD779DRAFT_1675220 [Infundibulicybe gibba]|nr:hypothetical protein BD779DRAFT_1675220 [Infundibulicybe gibba]
MASAPTALPDIGPTFGALLIGGYASIGFFGVLTLQCWLYYSQFPGDLTSIKLMVAFIWISEFLRSCFMVHATYYYTVLQWGNPSPLSRAVWSLELILLMTAIVELVVHLYFAHRVWIVSGRRWLMPSIICFFTISNFVMGACEYAFSIVETTFAKITGGFTGDFATAALCCVVAADWTITGSLIYYLRQSRSETRSSRLNTIINRLIFYAINVGALISAVDLVVLGLSSAELDNLYYLALFEIVGNLYANSLLRGTISARNLELALMGDLSSLNARMGLRRANSESHLSSFNTASQATHQNTTLTKASVPSSMSPVWQPECDLGGKDAENEVMLPAPTLPDIGPTFGALLIGGYASLGLFGILTLQCWLYYTRFPDDLVRIKFIVVFIWVTEFLRSCFMVHAIHYYTVLHWGDPSVLASTVWSLRLILLTTVRIRRPALHTILIADQFIVEFVVHLYFAYRVWIISGRQWLMTSIICFFTISNLVVGICDYTYSILETTFSRINKGFTDDFSTAALCCVIAADWTITGSLIYYLRRNRTESGWSRTNTIVDRLVFYAINVGILISAADLVVLALSSIHLRIVNLYYLALFEIVGNLYANSLVASLNARTGLRQQANVEYLSSFGVGAIPHSTQQISTLTKAPATPESGPDSEQKLSAGVSDLATTHDMVSTVSFDQRRSQLDCVFLLDLLNYRELTTTGFRMVAHTVNLATLKKAKNAVIGNPSAKVLMSQDDLFVRSLVDCLNRPPLPAQYEPQGSQDDIRIEAAHVISSLSYGSEDALASLLRSDAPRAFLYAILNFKPTDSATLRSAFARALRALAVSIADVVGPSQWGLRPDRSLIRSEANAALEYLFEIDSLDIYLPLLIDTSPQTSTSIAQLLGLAVRIPEHRKAVAEWVPASERVRGAKIQRGWEKKQGGGWVSRHLIALLKSRDIKLQEAALLALASLQKITRVLRMYLQSHRPIAKVAVSSALSTALALSKSRSTDVQLAACLCVTHILRASTSGNDIAAEDASARTVMNVVNRMLALPSTETPQTQTKACFILYHLVSDARKLCHTCLDRGLLTTISALLHSTTPAESSGELEEDEPEIISCVREAALTAVAAISLCDNDVRGSVAGDLRLLPVIHSSLSHRHAGIRYAACQCIRALSRGVAVLRTSFIDAGVGLTVFKIFKKEDEDRRVMLASLLAVCNLVNDFSPLRSVFLEQGLTARLIQMLQSGEPAFSLNALWALKNLMYKATSNIKRDVMGQVGWKNLAELLADTDDQIREQAFTIVKNIVDAEPGIDMTFTEMGAEVLLNHVTASLGSSCHDVALQAVSVLANLINGSEAQQSQIVSHPHVLSALTACLEAKRDIRRRAVACVLQLARNPKGRKEMVEAGMESTLRHICDGRAGWLSARAVYARAWMMMRILSKMPGLLWIG